VGFLHGIAVVVLSSTGILSGSQLHREKPPSRAAPDHDHGGVASRGDHAMGFSHETTTHHVHLYKTGGGIEVSANDRKDTASRDQIRMHLSHIAKLFAAGDFDVPMFIHDRTPPGAKVMSKLRNRIRYKYRETDRGAKILITTGNEQAVEAIHDFLRFQITDHQTGDSLEVSPANR
jgi:hypothetical protein